MAYWHINNENTMFYNLIVGLSIPAYKTLVFTPPVNVENAFLYTGDQFANFVYVKHSYNIRYKPIRVYSTTPTAYLGNLTQDVDYSLDFKILLPSNESLLGPISIPIYVGFGHNIQPLINDSNARWHIDTSEIPFLWANNSYDLSLITWGHVS